MLAWEDGGPGGGADTRPWRLAGGDKLPLYEYELTGPNVQDGYYCSIQGYGDCRHIGDMAI